MDRKPWIETRTGRGSDGAGFVRAFFDFAGWRAGGAAVLLGLGALCDGIGVLMLVPILGVVLPREGAPVAHGVVVGALARLADGYSETARLLYLLTAFVALMTLRSLVHAARDRTVSRLQLEFVESIRLGLVEALTSTGWSRLTRVSHARVIQALNSEIQQVGVAANWTMLGAVALAMLAVNMLVALVLSPAAGGLALGLALLGAMLCHPYLRHARALGRTVTVTQLGLTRSAVAFLAGLKLATAHGLEQGFVEEQRRASTAAMRDRLAFLALQIGARNASTALAASAGAATVVIGVAWFHLPVSVLLTLLLVLSRMTAPALVMQQAAHHVLHNLAAFQAIARLREMLVGPMPPGVDRAGAWRSGGCGRIALQAVRFRHAAEAGLDHLDLDIPAGAFVGVRGPSGSGKTSFLDLITGLLEPQAGIITIDGEPLGDAMRRGLRDRLAYVPQDPFLFDDTIRRNLAWSRTDATTVEMWDALARVGADALVQRLAQGLDTRIGERGVLLSAGERQRLALARALLRRPVLLVLDEATNALDVRSERKILTELASMGGRTTILLVAHRSESLALCDHILDFPVNAPPLQNTQFAPIVSAVL